MDFGVANFSSLRQTSVCALLLLWEMLQWWTSGLSKSFISFSIFFIPSSPSSFLISHESLWAKLRLPKGLSISLLRRWVWREARGESRRGRARMKSHNHCCLAGVEDGRGSERELPGHCRVTRIKNFFCSFCSSPPFLASCSRWCSTALSTRKK